MIPIRKFGWVEDKYDGRDFEFSTTRALLRKLPPEGSVISFCPAIYQQGNIGSCVGNEVAGQIAAGHIIQGKVDPQPSRLMIYYNARALEGTTQEDAGCSIRDAIKSVAKLGVCPEIQWPYIESNFALKPSPACYEYALRDRIVSYSRLGYSLTAMKACIVGGHPFSIGVRVFENFPMESGEIPMPIGEMIGGHAMMVVGYNDATQKFIVRNSWGREWGIGGYGSIPYEYILNPKLAVDFWTIRMVQ